MKQFYKIVFSAVVMVLMALPVSAQAVSPTSIPGAKTVTAAEAKKLFDDGVMFVDVRKDSDWDAGRVPEAEHLDSKKAFTEAALSKIAQKGDAMVIYCNGEKCMRSSKASVKAVGWGFSNVYYFRDGYPAWKAAGYPTE